MYMIRKVGFFCTIIQTLNERSLNMAGNTEYKNKYAAEKYDRVGLMLPKGRKDEIKAAAEKQGQSLNGYIATAIYQRIERDRKGE